MSNTDDRQKATDGEQNTPSFAWTYSYEDGCETAVPFNRVSEHPPGRDIYWLPAINRNNKRKKEDIRGSHWVIADWDPPARYWDKATGAETYPGALEEWRAAKLAELESHEPRFTLIVDSGRGFQAGYQLTGMGSPDDIEAARYALAGDDGDKCWAVNHVFRLWGTVNTKTGRPARIVRYEPDNLHDLWSLPSKQPPRHAEAEAITADVDTTTDLEAAKEKYFPGDEVLAAIIARGRDIAEPTRFSGSPDNDSPRACDRSDTIWFVCNELLRREVPDSVILGLLLNERHGISDGIYFGKSKGAYVRRRDPEAEARKQLGSAKAKKPEDDGEAGAEAGKTRIAGDGPPRISPGNQLDVARKFRDHEHPDLIFFRDEFWTYSWGRYYALDHDALQSQLALWLETCEAWDAKANKWMPFVPSVKFVGAVMSMLQNVTFVAPPLDDEGQESGMPFWKLGQEDSDFPPKHCLVCDFEIVNLTTGHTRPITPDFVTENSIKVAYDPKAACPVWLKCIHEDWFPGRPEDVMTLQEFNGLTLISEMRYHKGLVLWGTKRGGKGTIVKQHTRLLGSGNITSPGMKEMSEDFGMQPFLTALLAVFSDARTEARGSLAVTEKLLRLIGGDRMNVNRKGIKVLTSVELKARVLILANSPPNFADDTGTIASRFITIEMPETFYGKEDIHLNEKLARELPGYLNWCIEGLRRLLRNGRFTVSEAAKEAQEEMEQAASPIKAWAAERLTISPEYDLWVRTTDLFADYVDWCQAAQLTPLPLNVFGSKIRPLNPKAIRPGKQKAKPGYRGVALRHPVSGYSEWQDDERRQKSAKNPVKLE